MHLSRPTHRMLVGALSVGAVLAVTPSALAAVTAKVTAGNLTISGDASPDTITAVAVGGGVVMVQMPTSLDDPDGAGVNCAPARTGTMAPCSNVTGTINVKAGDGNDVITINSAPSAGLVRVGEILGEDGNDSITGFVNRGAYRGGAGNDTLVAEGPENAGAYLGGAGDDRITVRSGSPAANGDEGNDTIEATGTGRLNGGVGGPGDDTITGNPLRGDQFLQEPGNDTYRGGTAPRPAALPEGQPWVQLNEAPDEYIAITQTVVTITLDNVADDGNPGELDNVGNDIEVIEGGPFFDVIDASGAAPGQSVRIEGRGGDDRIQGSSGADELIGGNGKDEIRGGDGNDVFPNDREIFVPGQPPNPDNSDVLDGQGGDDTFTMGVSRCEVRMPEEPGLEVSVVGQLGRDDVRGGAGTDTVKMSATNATAVSDCTGKETPVDVNVSLNDLADDGTPLQGKTATERANIRADVENVETGGGNDTIIGSALANRLLGGAGDDTLEGGAAVDLLVGDKGRDTMRSRDGAADSVDCGPGPNGVVTGDTVDVLVGCDNPGNQLLAPVAIGGPGNGGGNGGGGTTGGNGGGSTAGGRDTRAPKMTGVRARFVRTATAGRIVVRVTLDEKALLTTRVLSASRRPLGTRSAAAPAGTRTVTVAISGRRLAALPRVPRRSVSIQVAATDLAGNTSRRAVKVAVPR